ncbi:hypothetical protein CYMTET_8864 [Cymbomonas tetramitiformis]|uniref:Uncharacterized protein n=1 Tax=Cymbomonas tetramitiformis TaxID=36881 RepID=A0AAE0LFK8_9CHLO|nr:hypothetical protein CYMTET_8864 [Cymbomonas tetramitiformis]
MWDYSSPSFVGVNNRIDLQKDEFTSVKDVYSLLRPDMWMTKDLKVVERVNQFCNGRKVVSHKEDVDKLVEYIPLLGKIFYLCAPHDIRLHPKYISLKDNLLTDLLSRLKLEEFHMRWAMRKREVLWRQDRDDWQFSQVLFAEMEFRPFTFDACVASSRANAFCWWSWSAEEDARKQHFDGLIAWMNLSFSVMYEILVNFLRVGTHAMGCADRARADGRSRWSYPTGCDQGAEELLEELAVAVERYQDGAYSKSTQRSYDTGVKDFLTFVCLGTLKPLLPASDAMLAGFIAFSVWFVQPGTIKSYLAGVRLLPLQQGWSGRATGSGWCPAALQGVRWTWDRPAKPVMPITLRDLTIAGAALWAVILVGFYGLFQKDNLTVDGEVPGVELQRSTGAGGRALCCDGRCGLDPSEALEDHLVRGAVPLGAAGGGAGDEVMPGGGTPSRLMLATGNLPEEAPPLFQVEGRRKRGALVPVTHAVLVAGLKRLAEQVGLDPARYAGHLLRRDRATAALRLKVDRLFYIKLQVDWKSDCYERYCELDEEQRLILPAALAKAAKELS